MPGPSNKKRAAKRKLAKAKTQIKHDEVPIVDAGQVLDATNANELPATQPPTQPLPDSIPATSKEQTKIPPSPKKNEKAPLPWFLYDARGKGLRIQDVPAFMSSIWAAPPNLEDPIRARYASERVHRQLRAIFPEDMTSIIVYNKSRTRARICPACRRFYNLDDIIPPHLDDYSDTVHDGPHREYEKDMSGLCSFMCFGIAAYRFPGSVGAWGVTADQWDPATRGIMASPVGLAIEDEGMGLMLQLTRSSDLRLLEWLDQNI